MKTCVVSNRDCNLHIPPFSHIEHPSRLDAVLNRLGNMRYGEQLVFAEGRKATREDILFAHSEAHISYCEQKLASGSRMLDEGDTYLSPESLTAAYSAAGCVLTAADLVMRKEYPAVFCAVRPPGHHAEKNTPMGFCIFNNIAVGARYLLHKYGIQRIAVIDWDVHHGNGTQDIFYTEQEVFFISLHQSPLYPGTGLPFEKGEGAGKGFTLNLPMKAHSTGTDYLNELHKTIMPAVEAYNPEVIMISAGFDAHTEDPLASVDLQTEDYAQMTRIIAGYAREHNLPLISVLEGGYNLTVLADSVEAHLQALLEI